MKIETWLMALDSLRANKLKAFLTMLGVVIGSACIVLVVTVALTGKRLIISMIEGIGSNIVYAQVVRVRQVPLGPASGQDLEFAPARHNA